MKKNVLDFIVFFIEKVSTNVIVLTRRKLSIKLGHSNYDLIHFISALSIERSKIFVKYFVIKFLTLSLGKFGVLSGTLHSTFSSIQSMIHVSS